MLSNCIESEELTVNFINASSLQASEANPEKVELKCLSSQTIGEMSEILKKEWCGRRASGADVSVFPSISIFASTPGEREGTDFHLLNEELKLSDVARNAVGEDGAIRLYFFDTFCAEKKFGDELEMCFACCACAMALCACCAAAEAVGEAKKQSNNNANVANHTNQAPTYQQQPQYYANQSPQPNTYGLPPNANNNNALSPITQQPAYGQPIYQNVNEPGYGEAHYTAPQNAAPHNAAAPYNAAPSNEFRFAAQPNNGGRWSCPKCTLINDNNFCSACGEPRPTEARTNESAPDPNKKKNADVNNDLDCFRQPETKKPSEDDAKLPPPLYGNYKDATELE
ncbi:hypothetical protein, conserved [Angomonas deanei]|uniref:RanBP2-type domain-containing protein n=1 Tax=Angomonas deanei TaxID=59799 RepID=A0A7G2CLA9_9TRYP|nr:hypothetical protein, conserved [Angomonas deanei]